MKKWFNEKYARIALYALGVILASLLFLFLVLNFESILSFLGFLLFSAQSVVFGVLLAMVLFPLCSRIEELLDRFAFRGRSARGCRILGVSLTFLVMGAVLSIIALSTLPMLNQNFDELRRTFEGYIRGAISTVEKNPFLYDLFRALAGVSGESASEIITEILEGYRSIFEAIAGGVISLLLNVLYRTADILLAMILAFYFLLARDTIRGAMRKMAVALFPRRFLLQGTRFFRNAYANVMQFCSARLLCSFLLGVLCYFFAWLAHIPFYPLLALIAMVLNIFPVVGPIASALLCTLIIFILRPNAAGLFFLLIIVLNLLEQLLFEKHLLPKRLRPNVALALVLVVVSYLIAGPFATIFVIPVFASLRDEGKIFLARRLTKKGYSLDTADYMSGVGAEMYSDPPTPEDAAKGEEEAPAADATEGEN